VPEDPIERTQSVRPGAPGGADVGPCAVIVSRYNDSVTSVMLRGALDAHARLGGDPGRLSVIDAPGAFELGAIAAAAAQSGVYNAVVCLGCVIKGETDHDAHIARAVAHTLSEVAARTGVPCAFGVLTTATPEQARERAGGEKGNKGADAMVAALESAAAIRALAPGHAPGLRLGLSGGAADKARAGGAR